MSKNIPSGLSATQIAYAVKRIEALRDRKLAKLKDVGNIWRPSEAQHAAMREETVRQLNRFSNPERYALLVRELNRDSGHRFNVDLGRKFSAARRAIEDAGAKVRTTEKRAATFAIKRIEKKFTEAADKLMFGGVVPSNLNALFAELSAYEG